MATILFLRFDCAFLIEESMGFAFSLRDRIEDEWLGSESGVKEVVEDVHGSLQRQRENLSA